MSGEQRTGMGVLAAKQLSIAFFLREYVRQTPENGVNPRSGRSGRDENPYSFGVVTSMCYEQMADHGAGYHHEC